MSNKYKLTSVVIAVGLILIPAPTEAQTTGDLSSMLDQARTQLMGMLDSLNGSGDDTETDTTASETSTTNQNQTESDTDNSVVTTDLLDQELADIRTLIQKQADATTGSDENTTYDAGSGLSLSSNNAFSVNSGAGSYWSQSGSDLFYENSIAVGTSSSPGYAMEVDGNINILDNSNSSGAEFAYQMQGEHALSLPDNGASLIVGGSSAGNGLNYEGSYFNTIVGPAAGENMDGNRNTMVGHDAGRNSTGNRNTFFGNRAGENENGTSAGSGNTFIGTSAGLENTGSNNVIVGRGANPDGSQNAILGMTAGGEHATSSVFVGYNAGGSTGSYEDRLYIENSSTSTEPLIYGEFDNNVLSLQSQTKITDGATSSPSYQLDVEISSDGAVAGFTDSNGTCTVNPTSTSLSCSSDKRLKDDITKLSSSTVLNDIQKLSAVTYRWDSQDGSEKHYGFVAQDVEDVYPEFVSTGPNGYKKLSYSSFIPVAIEGIKQLDIRLDELESGTTSVSQLANDGSFVQKVAHAVTDILKKGTQTFQTLVASERVRTPELCVGSTCLTEAQLKKVLAKTNTASNSFQTYDNEGTTQQREEESEGTEDENASSTTQTASSTPEGTSAATSSPEQSNASSTPATTETDTSTSTDAKNETEENSTSTPETSDANEQKDRPATSTEPTEDTADEDQATSTATSTDSQ